MTYNGFLTKLNRLMNFQECSICLEKMTFIVIRKKLIGFGIDRLRCGHCFHSHCMRDILNWNSNIGCPLCRVDIFDSKESKLLNDFTTPEKDILSELSNHRLSHVLREAVRIHNVKLVAGLIEIFDPSEVLHYYISKCDVDAIQQLLQSKCINWQRTMGGKTLLDAAIETDEPRIKNLISSKVMSTNLFDSNLYPNLSHHFL